MDAGVQDMGASPSLHSCLNPTGLTSLLGATDGVQILSNKPCGSLTQIQTIHGLYSLPLVVKKQIS